MSIITMEFDELINHIKQDTVQKRFNAKVFLLNNFTAYLKLVQTLSDMADLTIHLSDDEYCTGEDTIPTLKKALDTLNVHEDKNILIPSVGEYLRYGFSFEERNRCVFSIISRQAHSDKRVWIPIYAAKDEYLSVVGELDEEHYPDVVYEVNGLPSGFETTVYAKTFSNVPGLADAVGIKEWIKLWDKGTIKSGMTLATRFSSQVKESDGLYTIHVVKNPFQYFESRVSSDVRINPALGTDEQWLLVARHSSRPSEPIKDVLLKALNLLSFNPHQILKGWKTADVNTRWMFWLWYKLGLNSATDYIAYAVEHSKSYMDVSSSLEQGILNCFDNPNFDDWVDQRHGVVEELGISEFSQEYWKNFDSISDYRKQIKLLSGRTLDERAKIIEIVSRALRAGKTVNDFKAILAGKYPELLLYLQKAVYGYDDLQAYISKYKQCKIKDEYSLEISSLAESINPYDYDTRSYLLNKIKTNGSAYYLWVDGMGIEWIDLLTQKIADADAGFSEPKVEIGMAVLPTVTSMNMACADPETVSYKMNSLDSLGHIKDKSDCNYYSVVAKQIDLISKIAQDVIRIAADNPGMDIVITSDHGMSRMAAKAFHETDGVKLPKGAEVCSLGRYCQFQDGTSLPDISRTMKGDNVVAFRNHSHFVASGFAPGEIHGGAAPEEVLVPVIHYSRKPSVFVAASAKCSYTLDSTVTKQSSGLCDLHIRVQGIVGKITVEIQAKRIDARKVSADEWIASIPGLEIHHHYQAGIYLNNIYSSKTEDIYVKPAGMVIDDDL